MISNLNENILTSQKIFFFTFTIKIRKEHLIDEYRNRIKKISQ